MGKWQEQDLRKRNRYWGSVGWRRDGEDDNKVLSEEAELSWFNARDIVQINRSKG